MTFDFEQPRRAPEIPALPQDADVASPNRRKTSWFSGSSTAESGKTTMKEEAPGVLSRRQLLEGIVDVPKQPKKAKKAADPSSPTSNSNRDSVLEEVSDIFGRGFSMISPTKAWKRTSDSPLKNEAPGLVVTPEKTRPTSIKMDSTRPSSGSLTPRGFFKLLSSPKPSKTEPSTSLAEPSPTVTITPDTPARLRSLPAASEPPARLPPIPITDRHLKASQRRPRSHSTAERVKAYSKDPWHRHVYAHGPVRIAENTLATRLLADTYALAAPSPQLPTEEDIDELVGYFAKLLPTPNRGSHGAAKMDSILDSRLIKEVSEMSWRPTSPARPRSRAALALQIRPARGSSLVV